MNKPNRTVYGQSFRMDPRAQDQLRWIEETYKWLAPDVKISTSTIVRRAIDALVTRLEYLSGPAERQDGPSQKGEVAKLVNFTQNHGVYWPTAEMPMDQAIGEDGRPVAWRLLEAQHRSANHKRGMDALLKKGIV